MTFKTVTQIYQAMRAASLARIPTLTFIDQPGSIIATIYYAFSLAISDIYSSLQQLRNALFISLATGLDLDQKASDFGITRKASTFSKVYETLYRSSPLVSDILIPTGTEIKTMPQADGSQISYRTVDDVTLQATVTDEEHIFSTGTSLYALDQRKVSSLTQITGIVGGVAHTFTPSVDYVLNKAVDSQHKVQWLGVTLPDNLSNFAVTYKPLSVEVDMESALAGSAYVVSANSLTYVATLPVGIEEAINYEDAYQSGTNEETDDELRARITLFLQSLSRATVSALKYAALSVPGVKNVEVIEPPRASGLVIVVVDDGYGETSDAIITQVQESIDGTVTGAGFRAAGILVVVQAPTKINVDVTVYLQSSSFDTQSSIVESTIRDYINSLQGGTPIIRAELIQRIMDVSGSINIDLSRFEIILLTATPSGGTTGDIVIPAGSVPKALNVSIVEWNP